MLALGLSVLHMKEEAFLASSLFTVIRPFNNFPVGGPAGSSAGQHASRGRDVRRLERWGPGPGGRGDSHEEHRALDAVSPARGARRGTQPPNQTKDVDPHRLVHERQSINIQNGH